MKCIATILAVEERRNYAANLRDQLSAVLPTHLFVAPVRDSLTDAFERYRTILQFATLQNAKWHLFLEDDQAVTPAFTEHVDEIIELAERHEVDLFYLANRAIEIGKLGWIENYRVNRIYSWVAGAHGLLYRTKHIPKLLEQTECMPIDFIFWKQLPPHRHRHFQICRPVMAIHQGKHSTLHEHCYTENRQHLFVHPEQI